MSGSYKIDTDNSRIVTLEKPYEGHHGTVREIKLRPPTYRDFMDLGDPSLIVVMQNGMVPQEDLATIRKYIERLAGIDAGSLDSHGSLRDAMALRDAVKSFFTQESVSA